jgi:hypothetical protein
LKQQRTPKASLASAQYSAYASSSSHDQQTTQHEIPDLNPPQTPNAEQAGLGASKEKFWTDQDLDRKDQKKKGAGSDTTPEQRFRRGHLGTYVLLIPVATDSWFMHCWFSFLKLQRLITKWAHWRKLAPTGPLATTSPSGSQ